MFRITLFTLAVIIGTVPAIAADAGESATVMEIRAVIEKMNQAVTDRNLPGLLATFAENSVNISLAPAHRFSTDDANQKDTISTGSLQATWQMVAPILFSSTKTYERKITQMDVKFDHYLANAWVGIETRILSKEQDAQVQVNQFMEVYVLRQFEHGWQIVAMSNNRQD